MNSTDDILTYHIANSPLAVVEWDHAFRVCRWSGSAKALFGWTEAEVLGLHPDDWPFVHAEDRGSVARIMDELLSGEAPRNVSANRNMTRSGDVVHCEWYNSVRFDAAGQLVSILSLVHDVTDRVRQEQQLREQRRVLDLAGQIARFGGWSVDLEAQRCDWSDMVAEIHGMPRGYAPTVDQGIAFYAPEYRERIREKFSACAATGAPYDEEMQIITAQGERRWIHTAGMAVRDEQGSIVRVEGSFQDITALLETRDELHEANRQLAAAVDTNRALIDALPAHVALLDCNGRIIDVNEQWREFGRRNGLADQAAGAGADYFASCDVSEGRDAADARATVAGLRAVLARERDSFTYEYPCHGPSEQRWFRMMANTTGIRESVDGEPGVVVMHVDITERKLAEQQLERLVNEDPATGVLNRNGFVKALTERYRKVGWQPADTVVHIDLDGFRDINDAHGYETGDRVLKMVGQRLGDFAGPDALVGRMAGDKFVLLLPGTALGLIESRLRKLHRHLRDPMGLDSGDVQVEANFGYALLGHTERPVLTLLRESEVALYEGRADTDTFLCGYTEDLEQRAQQRMILTKELRRALDEQQFELHYQPKVLLATGKLIGCEALLRWNHPDRGLQSPEVFVPIAEQSRLIGPIGDWVLFEACRQLREWQDAGLDIVRVSVNASVVQFRLGHFTAQLKAALDHFDVEPASLTVEITESVFEGESSMLQRQIQELHELGVRIALDDFGTGYSSLLYLQRYPFDEIKIDQAFVRSVGEDAYSDRIVRTVFGLAESLGAEAIAEGIETGDVRDALVALGCTIGQGYFFSRPLSAEDFRWLLERRSVLPLTQGSASSGSGVI
ncbi:EAL domain-containing protein [Methylonatrum kenyense]|uniref:sensor domain-containing protein n=1 Tax=Methylonatrum kenyense TaxID=455253 RepID=UPI0020BE550F|nr:EAL domain-containing protein [Methylonatrum kenyense]MCK8514959.1 EAL domain-containing protein [Methylonatrum kenyense]